MTQREFDEKIASGEFTLVTEDSLDNPSVVVPKEQPTTLVPLNRKYNSQEKSLLNSLGTRAGRFQDPTRIALATEVLSSGATPASIASVIGNLQREEVKAKGDQALTLDRKKAKQKYAEATGKFQTSLDSIEYLIDNFDDDYVGYGDTIAHNIGKVLDLSDPKMSAYQKKFGTLLPNFKELENMGASFTESEQKMLRGIMPEIDSGDTLFRSDLVNFAEILKSKIEGKLNALEDGSYETGALRDVVARYDAIIDKGKKKFGLADSVSTKKDSAIPSGLKSLSPTATDKHGGVVPTSAKPMSREEKLKFLRGE